MRTDTERNASNTKKGDRAWIPDDYLRRPGESVIVEDVFDDGVAVYFEAEPPTGFEHWRYDELVWDATEPEEEG